MRAMPTMADPEVGDLDGIVDLNRFPLHQAGKQPWKELVADIRHQLRRDGLASLGGFLHPIALRQAASEIAAMEPYVTIRRQRATVYHRPDLADGVSPGAAGTELTWIAGHVTRDMIQPFTVPHRLYVSAQFKTFVAACVGQKRVYEYADPLAGLVATVLPPGGQYPWHYDTNEFVLTVVLQEADAGGEFEYHRNLRSPGNENLDELARTLAGNPTTPARRIAAPAGHLQLFLGRYSLHQVRPVIGTTARHVLVLSYADRPGVIGPVDRTRSVYGRVTEAHLLAEQTVTSTADDLIL